MKIRAYIQILCLLASLAFISCTSDDADETGGFEEIGDVGTSGTEDSFNGHAYVDLELPSGTLWATCNVGAATEDGVGGYFAWGETSAKENYAWSTYSLCGGNSSTMTKYCLLKQFGTVDGKAELEASDDVARKQWGGLWRLPSIEQMEELMNKDNCLWTWVPNGNKSGYRVTSKKNGNNIFLLAAGYRSNTLNEQMKEGRYLTRSLNPAECHSAYTLYFDKDKYNDNYSYRNLGFSARPVVGK